eukprot:200216-Rhodomonas_salina.4
MTERRWPPQLASQSHGEAGSEPGRGGLGSQQFQHPTNIEVEGGTRSITRRLLWPGSKSEAVIVVSCDVCDMRPASRCCALSEAGTKRKANPGGPPASKLVGEP